MAKVYEFENSAKLEEELLISSQKQRVEILQYLMQNNPELFIEAIKVDSTRIADVSAKNITPENIESYVNVAMDAYNVGKIGGTTADTFVGMLSKDMQKNQVVLTEAVKKHPDIYFSGDSKFRTTETTGHISELAKIKEISVDKLDNIPKKLRNKEVISNFLDGYGTEAFARLTKKEANDLDNINKIVETITPLSNVDEMRTNFLNKISSKNLNERASEIVEKNPLLLFKQETKRVIDRAEMKSFKLSMGEKQLVTSLIVDKPTSLEGQAIIKSAIMSATNLDMTKPENATVSEEFFKELPTNKNCLTQETLMGIVKECQPDKLPQLIKNLNLMERRNYQNKHGQFISTREVFKVAAIRNPEVLGSDTALREHVLKTSEGKKIFYRAICQDPTMLQYGAKPLNTRQQQAVLESSVRGMANAAFSPEKKQECQHIFDMLMGATKELSIKNADGTLVDVSKNFKGINISKAKQSNIFKMMTRYNPKLMLQMCSNDKYKKNKYFKKQYDKVVQKYPELVKQFVEEKLNDVSAVSAKIASAEKTRDDAYTKFNTIKSKAHEASSENIELLKENLGNQLIIEDVNQEQQKFGAPPKPFPIYDEEQLAIIKVKQLKAIFDKEDKIDEYLQVLQKLGFSKKELKDLKENKAKPDLTILARFCKDGKVENGFDETRLEKFPTKEGLEIASKQIGQIEKDYNSAELMEQQAFAKFRTHNNNVLSYNKTKELKSRLEAKVVELDNKMAENEKTINACEVEKDKFINVITTQNDIIKQETEKKAEIDKQIQNISGVKKKAKAASQAVAQYNAEKDMSLES